jgi:diaminopimelate decarboxylase
MDHFTYKQGVLHAEGVALPEIAEAIGTPFYCYSTATLQHHVRVLRESLAALNPLICFAVKSNSNLAVLRTLHAAGTGADVVSEGEIRAALAAGISPQKIIFSGVGKTRSEMRFALTQNIFQFNVESEPELRALSEEASQLGVTARIALRVNPDVDAATHAKISTGKKENKFGVAIADAPALYATATTLSGIDVQGVSMHIGSQLTSLAPFEAAYTHARTLVETLRKNGIPIRTLDIGGGLGVPYHEGTVPPAPAEYGAMATRILDGLDVQLIVEPGRLIAGNAGVLVSRVIYVKREGRRTYLITDAAMNDLMRPALYDAYHTIVPVQEVASSELAPVDIVGPVCETGDTFATDRLMTPLAAGDLVAFRTAGAYGASMSNTYNLRPLVAETLVNENRFAVVRARQTYEQLLARDSFAPWQE